MSAAFMFLIAGLHAAQFDDINISKADIEAFSKSEKGKAVHNMFTISEENLSKVKSLWLIENYSPIPESAVESGICEKHNLDSGNYELVSANKEEVLELIKKGINYFTDGKITFVGEDLQREVKANAQALALEYYLISEGKKEPKAYIPNSSRPGRFHQVARARKIDDNTADFEIPALQYRTCRPWFATIEGASNRIHLYNNNNEELFPNYLKEVFGINGLGKRGDKTGLRLRFIKQ